MTDATTADYLLRTVEFLRRIGMSCEPEPGVTGFLGEASGVLIRDGGIVYCPDRAIASDMLLDMLSALKDRDSSASRR